MYSFNLIPHTYSFLIAFTTARVNGEDAAGARLDADMVE